VSNRLERKRPRLRSGQGLIEHSPPERAYRSSSQIVEPQIRSCFAADTKCRLDKPPRPLVAVIIGGVCMKTNAASKIRHIA
jgi:hypothetical protein